MDADDIEAAIHLCLGAGAVIAAFRRNDRKKRFFAAGIMLLAYGGFLKYRSSVMNSPRAIAYAISARAPQIISPEFRFDGAKAENSRLILIYTLREVRGAMLDRAAWKNTVAPHLRELMRNSPDAERLAARKIPVTARFFSSDGVLIGDIPIDSSEPGPRAIVDAPKPPPTFREFTNRSGVAIRARIIHFDGTNVTISREDGRNFTNPIGIYSDEDQAYIRNWKRGSQ